MTTDTTRPVRDRAAYGRGQRVRLIRDASIRPPAMPLPLPPDLPRWPPYGPVAPIALGRVVGAPHPFYVPGVWVDFDCDPVHVPRWFDRVDALRCLEPCDE